MSHLHTIGLITKVQELLTHPMLHRTFGNPIFSLGSPFEWTMLNHARNCVQADNKQDIEELDEAGVAKRDERFLKLATLRELNRQTTVEGGEVTITAVKRVCEPKDINVSNDRLAAQTRAQIVDERMAGRLSKEHAAKRYVVVLAEKKRIRDEEILNAYQVTEDTFALANSSEIELSTGEHDDKDVADFGTVEHLLEGVMDRLADGTIWAWRKLCDVQSHRDGIIVTRDNLRAVAESLAKDLGVNLLKVQAQGANFAAEVAAIEAELAGEVASIGADLDAELAALPAEPRSVRVVKSPERIERERIELEAAQARVVEDVKKAERAAKAAATRTAKKQQQTK